MCKVFMHMCRTLTLGVLDKDLGNIIYFGEAGTPALLSLLCSLGAAGVSPHELVIIQGSIRRALGIAPPAAILLHYMPDNKHVCTFCLGAQCSCQNATNSRLDTKPL